MKPAPVPPIAAVRESRKSSFVMVVVAAFVTLLGLSLIGAISTPAMIVVAGVGFILLAIRFVWLVWRELE